tara:strand:- start:352 stop:522 length:171 start_codon:yes stop_codon:yes gene_type:complete
MKIILILLLLLITSCAKKNNDINDNIVNFDNEMNIDKFISKLKIYSIKNPYPDIKD